MSTGWNRLPAGIALRHIRIIAGRIVTVVLGLSRVGLGIIVIPIARIVAPPWIYQRSTGEKPAIVEAILVEPAIMKPIAVDPVIAQSIPVESGAAHSLPAPGGGMGGRPYLLVRGGSGHDAPMRRSAFRDVLIVPQRVVEIENALAKRSAARIEAYIGASEPGMLPIALVRVRCAACQGGCSKGAG